MKKIAVFCGSSLGKNEVYREQARLLGETIARLGIGLVYGGGNVGLMKYVADGAIRQGGEVTGVIPAFLNKEEIAHAGLTELIVVETMHERKAKMNELSDGIIALPGGYGTMEEFFEMITWGQLHLHQKPVAILNTNGFYNPLIRQVETMLTEGFLKEPCRELLIVDDTIPSLLEKMRRYQPPVFDKRLTSHSQ
ncbi:MAG: TIGR00730 family Rossman fold protein [Tannerellaceae bacterium]|jgi:uncharacterized protein (TIGR00730 family)|nr:TIGR00730 family Rossman fold protein [Tannerellaceae bacterium]